MFDEKELSPSALKLLEYMKEGKVFHGSINPNLKELEPMPATSLDEETYNKSTAVYAAIRPSSACILSIIKQSYEKGNFPSLHFAVGFNKKNSSGIAKIPRYFETSLTEKGLVYVLPSNTFDLKSIPEGAWQTKSLEPVKPIDMLEVTLQDYYDLGGEIQWTEEELPSINQSSHISSTIE